MKRTAALSILVTVVMLAVAVIAGAQQTGEIYRIVTLDHEIADVAA
jgi:hypothetical protein